MIRVCDLSMPLDYTEKDLREAAAKALNIPLNEIKAFSLARRSIDARKKDQVHFICAVNLSLAGEETAVLKRSRYKKDFLGAALLITACQIAFLPAFKAHRNRDRSRRTICRADSRSGRRPAYFVSNEAGMWSGAPGMWRNFF